MQRLPGHHRAHGRSGEPGHHDGQVEGTPPQPHPPAAQSRTLPGLRPCCSHRDAPVHRSRRCSMRLMGSRATLERRTASTRSAFPPPLTWCAVPPCPASGYQGCDAGCMHVHCALCRGSWVVSSISPTGDGPPIGVPSPTPEADRVWGGGRGGCTPRLVRHVHGSLQVVACHSVCAM